MTGVKRYSLNAEYNDGDKCWCDISESKDGWYVEYRDYMRLLSEYMQERTTWESRIRDLERKARGRNYHE